MTIDDGIRRLQELKILHDLPGDTELVIDRGSDLAVIEDIDLGGSDEGVVIWCGDRVEDDNGHD